MKVPSWLLIATHAAALGAGWALFRSSSSDGSSAMVEPPAREARGREERERGVRVIREMRDFWKAEMASMGSYSDPVEEAAKEARAAEERKKLLDDLRAGRDATVLPADVAKELDRLKALAGMEFYTMAAAWMKADPKAALEYLGKSDEDSTDRTLAGIQLWVSEADPDLLQSIAAGMTDSQLKKRVTEMMLTALPSKDPSRISSLLEGAEESGGRRSTLQTIFGKWPAERSGEALAWILGNLKGAEAGDAVGFMVPAMSGDAEGAKALLRKAMAELDPAALKGLQSSGYFIQTMRQGLGPQSPLEERIAVELLIDQGGDTPEEKRGYVIRDLVERDVGDWVRGEGMMDQLRTGAIDAAEAWKLAEDAFPQFGGKEQDALQLALFRKLATGDPEGAIREWRETLGPEKLASAVLSAAKSEPDPQAATRLIAALPEADLRGGQPAYDAWFATSSQRALAQYGSFWIEWVKEQPPGLGRDLLLDHTADQLAKAGRERESAGMRALVKDPEVKSRSAKP